MKKTYFNFSIHVTRMEEDVITTSVGASGLSGFGGYGGSTGGTQADAPDRKTIWDK